MTLQALIFDVDGTLAETEETHRRAFNEIFAEANLNWEWDRDLYEKLLETTGGKERIAAFIKDVLKGNLEEFQASIPDMHAKKTERYVQILKNGDLELRPGVTSLIEDARNAGLKVAIATTTNAPNVEALCQCCWSAPAHEIFDVVAAGDEVKAKKPAPDVYDLALERLGLPAENCIAFEDSRNGLVSAKDAGLKVCITPSIYTNSQTFEEADLVIPTLENLNIEDLHKLL